MKIDKFENIESWKKARSVVNKIYDIPFNNSSTKDYALSDQIKKAAISIMANIAEGFDSGSDKSFINFLNYAYRSASEVQSLLYITLDQNYITENEFYELYDELNYIKNLIGSLIKYLKNTIINLTKD